MKKKGKFRKGALQAVEVRQIRKQLLLVGHMMSNFLYNCGPNMGKFKDSAAELVRDWDKWTMRLVEARRPLSRTEADMRFLCFS